MAKNGLFQPILTMVQKSRKSTPQTGNTRVAPDQPTLYPSSTNYFKGLCNLVPSESLASARHGFAMWGQDAKIGKIGHLGGPARVGFRGDLVKPSLEPRTLISPLVAGIRPLACSHDGCLLFPDEMVAQPGRKQPERQNLATWHAPQVAKLQARPDEQIRNSSAIDPWSYPTKIFSCSWPGALPHGDMGFPNWPEMTKTAKIHRSGPHSRSHLSMTMASNNLIKVAVDT